VLKHLDSITIPMLHISSWYDIFLEGALNAYQGIKEYGGSQRARRGQRMLIGPWAHLFPYIQPTSNGTGEVDFGDNGLVDLFQTQLDWYDYWLKDRQTGIMDGPPVSVFVMGENRWRSLEDWPPPQAHYISYYFHSEGSANGLGGKGTLSEALPSDELPDTFIYDPNDPVPSLGGGNLALPLGVYDQRPAEERDDVLVYTTEALDRPVEVIGPIKVFLWAASSACDTDFTAKLVDVHPDGYASNIQDGIIRARYRDSRTEPTLIEPGKVYKYEIDLWATGHVFLPGHRIRVDISSSNFPRFDRNQNTGAKFGEDDRIEAAQQTIYHRSDCPSQIVLPVIPR
jgi:putative CocE/NonD family hydrolase